MKPNARTTYTAPSATKIGLHISNAQDRNISAIAHAKKTAAAVTAAALKAKTAKDRIIVIEKAVAQTPPVLALAKQVETDIDDLTALLLQAHDENDFLQGDLTITQTELAKAQTEKATLQTQVNGQTILLNTANSERNAAITQGAVDKKHAHEYKFFIIGLAVFATGAIMFALFRGLAFVPPLAYATIAAPAAVGVFLYFYLGSGG
jgi:hypothetical protein